MDDSDETRPDAARRAALRAGAMAPLLALPGCAFFDNLFSDTRKNLPGKREDVLPVNEALQPPRGAHPTVVLPAAVETDWALQGGVPSHDAGDAALPGQVRQSWTASIGQGSAYRTQVTATPLAVGETVFTMDSAAVVSAFAAANGHRLWRFVTKPKKIRSTNVGGGIGYAEGVVFAATGYGEVLALDARTGAVRWRHTLDTPARSAPTIVDGMVYLTTIDQQLVGLRARDGHQVWSYDGTQVDTTLLGQPAPAYAGGIVLAGFGSGDVVAIRGDSGAVAWSDSISASSNQAGVARISTIAALPVIVGEVAIVVGSGGLMIGADLRAGRRLWEREVSGLLSPVAAGEFVFVTTSDEQVAAIQARTGEVAWLSRLPQYTRPKTQGGPIIWTGPVLAGGQLIYASTRNRMIMLDAVTGVVNRTVTLPGSVTVPPIVAHNTLYLVTDDGLLRAYR